MWGVHLGWFTKVILAQLWGYVTGLCRVGTGVWGRVGGKDWFWGGEGR